MTVALKKAVTINRSAPELYRFWRDLANLPRFMSHLQSVEPATGGRSRWVAKAPLGGTVEWEAEIVEDRENERIAWRSSGEDDVQNSGVVRFVPLSASRGTEVQVELRYDPPGGVAGRTVARLFGEEPGQQIAGDLRRFKALMEAGEVPTVEGQPAARRTAQRPARREAQAA